MDRATFNAVEAADVSGLTYRQVIGALVHGRMRGKRVGQEWRVTRRALEAYVAEMRLAAERAVEQYAVAGRMADAVRAWWHKAIGTAQLEAADAARAFASTHAALHRQVTANGQAEPALVKRIAAQLATLRDALDRVDYLDDMYSAVVVPLEAEATRLAQEASHAASLATTRPALVVADA